LRSCSPARRAKHTRKSNRIPDAPTAKRGNVFAYFLAFLTGDAASQIQSVAVAWTVYTIHHRPFDLGLVGLVMFAPSLLLVLITGHVADRYDRKRIVIVTAVAEAVISLGFAALAFAHVQQLGIMLGVVFFLGVVRAFAQPAESAILINIVEPAAYMSMQARYSSLRELVVIAGPALGGALVAFSPAVAFSVAAVLTFIAAGAFAFVRLQPNAIETAREDFSFDTALEGLRFIFSQRVVLGAISLDLFAVLFGGATALLPVYAADVLHAGAVGFGILRSASGLGAAAMAVALARWPPARHVGRTLLFTVVGFGVATLVFAFSRTLWLSVLALAAAGAFDMVSMVIRHGLVQLNTPDAMRGRVNAVENVFIGASNQLGSFESGTVAQFLGAVPAVAIGGAATIVVVGACAIVFPEMRRSDRFVTTGEAPA
jgi:MFS family permease